MGYQANSDVEAFDPITGNAALSLLHEVKKMFQVTIVDCTTPKTDEVTDKALKYADVIIVLLEPNCLGVGFLKAQRSYIRNYFSDDRSYIFLAAKVEKISALDDFEKRLGVMFDNNLPYTQQARYKLHTHELFEKYGGDYGKSVDSIANRLKEEASS
jgi:Flp pilus assembly CpaE family ATPase